ncbi:MAG: hypothetical protein DYG92_08680 [Leptolyngbya sp. PLA1]|nr:hypothetical protein [Leptolyngbya sp. PLA1]
MESGFWAGMITLVVSAALVSDIGLLGAQPAVAQIKSAADVKSLLSDVLPAGASEIVDAMKTAKVGETLTLRGHIALAKDAISKDTATFTLVDEAARGGVAPASERLPESETGVPSSARAVVQILDSEGQPLRAELAGKYGLKPGAEVFVTGKVLVADGAESLVLSALAMHIPRSPVPSGFFLASAPADARDVSEARKAGGMKVGDQVVLRGRVGGSKTPFVAGRAVFTLMGRGLKACNENPDDRCSQPWDYCCESRDDIMANSVTVQAVDAKGQVLRTDMKGRRGLRELSEVVVVGKIASTDGKGIVVNATGAHVVR